MTQEFVEYDSGMAIYIWSIYYYNYNERSDRVDRSIRYRSFLGGKSNAFVRNTFYSLFSLSKMIDIRNVLQN